MVISCAAFGCTNRQPRRNHTSSQNRGEVRFHRFPHHNPALLQEWVKAMRRRSWKPSKFSYICSKHFTQDCYFAGKSRLKDDAVPTIFNFPNSSPTRHLKKSPVIIKNLVPSKSTLKPILANEKVSLPRTTGITIPTNARVPSPTEAESVIPSVTDMVVPATTISTSSSNQLSKTCFVPLVRVDAVSSRKLVESTTSETGGASPPRKRLRNAETQTDTAKAVPQIKKLMDQNPKISDMHALLLTAKTKHGMSEDAAAILMEKFGSASWKNLMHEHSSNNDSDETNETRRHYSSAMREFALVLYFYSPKTYDYLRKHGFRLPHPSLIRSWTNSVNCEPGFLVEGFQHLKEQVVQDPSLADCVLIIDSMPLRQQVVWNKEARKYSGYVEGAGLVDGNDLLASEALLFLVVSLTNSIKCPVGYFFVDKVNSSVLAQLINTCLVKLADAGIQIWSVTVDGTARSVEAIQILGCNVVGSVDNFCSYFQHPALHVPVYIIFDLCHLLKLARNALAEIKELSSSLGPVRWSYLEELQNEAEFANKLLGAQFKFLDRQLKVLPASQTLTSETADLLEFLLQSGNPNFSGAKATIAFIRSIGRMFDLLNSKNPFGKQYKSPLTLENKVWWEKILDETFSYLLSLKVGDVPVIKSQRKTFLLGFLVSITSIRHMARQLLTKPRDPLKYFLSYKVSQDHVGLFFSNVKACAGSDVLNTYQFTTALRMLLLGRSGSVDVRSNCRNSKTSHLSSILEFRGQKRAMIEDADEDDLSSLPLESCLNNGLLSEYRENVFYYIGQYITSRILQKCVCKACAKMLLDVKSNHECMLPYLKDPESFSMLVSCGRSKLCSKTVFDMIRETEKAFQFLVLQEPNTSSFSTAHLSTVISYLQHVGIKFHHAIENEFGWEELHEVQMTKQIIEMYLKIRLASHPQLPSSRRMRGNSSAIRQKPSKFILFRSV